MTGRPDVIRTARCCYCKEKNITYNRTWKEVPRPFCSSRCERLFHEENGLPAFVIIERFSRFNEPCLCVIARGLLVRVRLRFEGSPQ